MVTFQWTWTTFLVLVLILSWFPNDSRALQTGNNRHKVWSLYTKDHGRHGGVGVNAPVVPWTELHPRLWSTSSDEDGFHNPLQVNNKNERWRKWKLYMGLSVRFIQRLSNYWIPPIPFQDSMPIKQWHRQFYPRFVIRETLLGVRIMMRIYCVLVLVGMVFEAACPWLPSLPPTPLDSSYESPLHIMEVLVKHYLLARLPSMPIALRLTMVGPLLEEIAYRGIGFLAIYWKMWWGLFLWSSLVGFSPFLASLWMCCHVGNTLVLPGVYIIPHLLSIPILGLVKIAWVDWIPRWLLLALYIRLLRLRLTHNDSFKRRSIEAHAIIDNETRSNNQDHIPTIPRCDTCPTKPGPTTLRRHERIVQRIACSIQQEKCNNTTTTDEQSALEPSLDSLALSQQLERVLLFLTRWKTSSLFAAAHIPSRGTIPSGSDPNLSLSCWRSTESLAGMTIPVMTMGSKDQYMYLRKFWGVFGSSFLVESRLVSQRGTIWGAMGAHMCFNTLTLFRVILESFLVEWGIISVRMIPLLLVPIHHVLEWMGTTLEQVEINMIEEEKES